MADAGKPVRSGHDAGADAASGCQGSCTATDAAGADSGRASDGRADAGVTDAGPAQDGGRDAALAGDACVPRTEPAPGTLLLIFDRSLSMNEDWNGMPRWQAAGSAMLNALKPVQDLLTIGAVLFPSPNAATGAPGSCVDPTGITCAILGGNGAQLCMVSPITAPDQVSFKAGPDAIAELQTGASGSPKYQPVGQTPTSEAVAQADMALSMTTLVGKTVVVLITDGEPNCMWDQNATTTTITSWLTQKNIKTYVVGLPGTSSANATMVLDALAQAGGTTQYLTPDDPRMLTMLLEDIVQQQVQPGSDGGTGPCQ
jgi:hypothetical protein